MKTETIPVTVTVRCPHCNEVFTPEVLRSHWCQNRGRLSKQDWWVVVDKARVAAGLPEMVYGYEVEYEKINGEIATFRTAACNEGVARRKAIYKSLFRQVTKVTPYTYARYCSVFGIPGSKM